MAIKIAINGFGRIGRQFYRAMIEKMAKGEIKDGEVEVVAVNDLTDPQTLAHLLKFDSIYGILPNNVEWNDESSGKSSGELSVDGHKFTVLSEPDPNKLPWKRMGIDVVVESTGRFVTGEDCRAHIRAGAKKVVMSAPAKKSNVNTYIIGVNEDKLTPSEKIISNASCTTNCIAPVMAIIKENIGIKKSMMTTVHSYTADQVLVDGPHKDLRRARSAAINIVPTTTGAAITTTKIIPELEGIFDGLSIRVPTPVVSISDITIVTKREVTVEEINALFEKESGTPRWKGIVICTSDPVVSTDIIGNPHSAIIDLPLTQVVDKDLLKIVAWYDNEWGYSNRLVEQAIQFGKIS
ncbi:type I glyceraldehyde-3-phosphate dehydrogenase [Candidatus Berkelbacteria bacterium CG10_big_fil_rev_8_21_14_0_10_41_12]|uniref:Glyceraldehyde-3-phosphate dehydrogenase n=1 Tax=Candidatus Berkelbacteria bacterium CG10_big_fil_rev_8_21_14_0_10_41_12 TaxID=1974513 RepID=A0A2M6WWV9_9BACT|nr:MAG: type I glyceraldehyde-3-phosphate dehydrogenase [Candidatus Berkelbacteria bacterium CG10_big_fil_rev_8_21_14_0_10_41_12]